MHTDQTIKTTKLAFPEGIWRRIPSSPTHPGRSSRSLPTYQSNRQQVRRDGATNHHSLISAHAHAASASLWNSRQGRWDKDTGFT